MTRLRRLWRGELPLDRAFWDYAVLGGLVVNVVTSVAFLLLIAAKQTVAAVIVGYGVSLPWNLLAVVGVWRAAERAPGRKADLYRLVTVAGAVLLSLT